jgi:hemerythrin
MYSSKDDGRNKVSANFNTINSSMIWKSMYHSGHSSIDSEHEALFNALQDLSKHLHKASFKQALKDLIDLTKEHFKSEEVILRNSGYQDFALHVSLHEDLLKTAYDLYKSYDADEDNDEENLIYVINALIMGHLVSEDVNYYDSLKIK